MATKYIRAGGGLWSAADTWSLSSGGPADTTAPTAADDVVTDSNSGASTVGANISVKSFVQTGTPGAVTNNGFTISSAGNVTLLSGKYIAASNAARISITAAGTLTTGGNAMGGITLAAAAVCGDNLTFIADKLCTLILNGNFLDVNGKTISGNSAINRLLIYSNVIGTPRTLTLNGGAFANCDFRDIAFANGGADLDLSAITGNSGNCGGNSMSGGGTLTFTTPRICTFTNIGGDFDNVANWDTTDAPDRVPLPQDVIRFQPITFVDQTININIPRIGDIDFSGCGATNLPRVNLTTAGLTYEAYGSVNLTGITAGGWSCTKEFSFHGRSNASLMSNGQILCDYTAGLRMYMIGAILTANDALLLFYSFIIFNGTFNSNYSVTATAFQTSVGTTVNFGNNVITVTLHTNPFIGYGIINAGTSTIALTYTGATACNFLGGTNVYNDIKIAPGSGVLTFSGAFTFHDMVMSSAGTRSIVMTKATTYTQTGDNFLSGTAGNVVTITSNTAGAPFTLSKASGLIASNYISLKDSIATGGATWLAGYNSTNISGNTGWHFNSPASGAGVIEFVGAATAKALCRGIPAAAEIVFTATATAKALCSAAGSGVIEFVGSCSAIVAAWKSTGLFKATERYIGQYFKASKRRNN